MASSSVQCELPIQNESRVLNGPLTGQQAIFALNIENDAIAPNDACLPISI
jgi:hypothetical protein